MTLRRNTYYAYLLCFPIVESCQELSRYNYEVSREKMQFVKSKIFLTLVFILQSVSTMLINKLLRFCTCNGQVCTLDA